MIGSKGLHSYFQLYGRITVGGNKLVMVKLNNIALILSYDACHTYQLSCFIRNQYRNCKIRSLWISPCWTTEDMVITSIFPPLKIDTTFFR